MDAVSGIAIGVEQRLILICVAGRHHDQARIFPLAKNIGGQAIECSRPRRGVLGHEHPYRNGHAEYPIHVWSCDFRQGNCRHSEGAIGLFLVARSGRQKLHRLNPMLDRDGALRRQRINEITVKGKTGQTGTVAYVVLDSPRWINAVQIVEANVGPEVGALGSHRCRGGRCGHCHRDLWWFARAAHRPIGAALLGQCVEELRSFLRSSDFCDFVEEQNRLSNRRFRGEDVQHRALREV